MAVTDIPVTVGDFKALLASYGVDFDRVCEPPFITVEPGMHNDNGEVFLVVTEIVHNNGLPFVPFLGKHGAKGRRSGERRADSASSLAKQTRWLPLRVVT